MTVTLRGEKREGDVRMRKAGKKLVIEETRNYTLFTDDKSTSRIAILNTPGLPRVGTTVSSFGLTVCRSISCNRSERNPLEWTAVAEFSSEVEEDTSGANESEDGNPTGFIPIASAQFETYQAYKTKDIEGKPFANTAGSPFDGALPQNRTLVRYDFEQFEPATTTLDEISERNETVNELEFLGKPPKTLRLSVKDASIGFYYGYKVWRINYSLTYKKETWKFSALNIGSYYKQDVGGVQKEIAFKTAAPNQVNYMGFLNPQGGPSSVPTEVEFDIYDTSDFASFLRVVDSGA